MKVTSDYLILIDSLEKLNSGNVACPQIYAASVMAVVNSKMRDSLPVLPYWSAESFAINRHLKKLLDGLIHLSVSSSDKCFEPELEKLESLVERVEYTYCDDTLNELIRDSLEFIESIQDLLGLYSSKR